MKPITLQSTFTLLVILLVTTCTEESSPIISTPVQATLTTSRDTISFYSQFHTEALKLSVHPTEEIGWQVSQKPDWLSVTPDGGTISGDTVDLMLNILNETTQPGNILGFLKMELENESEATVLVYCQVKPQPLADVEAGEIVFPANKQGHRFTIGNQGLAILNYSFATNASWLHILPDSGSVPILDSTDIHLSVNRNGLEPDTYTSTIDLSLNTRDSLISIPVSMEVIAAPYLVVSEPELYFDYLNSTGSFTIYNQGNVAFTWNVNTENDYLIIDPRNGTIEPGDSSLVQVAIDRAQLPTGSYDFSIEIENNVSQTSTIAVNIDQYWDNKITLNHKVTDAVYDENYDRILMVSEEPNQLFVFSTLDNTEEIIDLHILPNCMAVDSGGTHAVIGHDGYVTYVNLSTMAIENTYPMSADVIDVVLPGNGWIYGFPRLGQWTNIRCVEISSGLEYLHTGRSLSAGSLAKLHPSREYIYVADNGGSPSDFEKYDIRSGIATYMYDSPYHGDYTFSGDIWISKDGSQLYARSGNIFSASNSQPWDILYEGRFADTPGNLVWVEHSISTNQVCFLSQGPSYTDPPSNEIQFYDHGSNAYQGSRFLADFILPRENGTWEFYQSQAHYAFFTRDGAELYVLCRAEDESGILSDWALAIYDVDDLP